MVIEINDMTLRREDLDKLEHLYEVFPVLAREIKADVREVGVLMDRLEELIVSVQRRIEEYHA